MARYLPDKRFNLCGLRFSLNPGPFSQKEHLLLVVLASSGTSVAYGADIIAIQVGLDLLGSSRRLTHFVLGPLLPC